MIMNFIAIMAVIYLILLIISGMMMTRFQTFYTAHKVLGAISFVYLVAFVINYFIT
jgi:hypothetical protein